MLIKFVKTQK